MGKSFFEKFTVDRNGNDLKIRCEGVDDKVLSHFGGLDLHVKATKEMISDSSSFSFPEKAGDYMINHKVIALYLNEIGELIRNSSIVPEYLEENSNIQLVKDFIENIKNNPNLVEIIDKDNGAIRKEKERELQEEQEDAEIFKNIILESQNKKKR
jgi:hypothetical protein